MASNPSTTLCRYFASGSCTMGDKCRYSHDRRHQEDMVCPFHLKGSCDFGTACRFTHQRPKTENKRGAVNKKPSSLPKPCQLPPPGLNVSAAEFIPSWKRTQPGSSYSAAAGAVESFSGDQPLPLCPYFEMGECNDANCRFVHGNVCDMCSRACIHPFDEEQQRRHFHECSAAHEAAMEEAFLDARSTEKQCGICMENIRESNLRFGILEGCRHCFCLQCIREWRMKQGYETTVVRSCPECRQHSDYVVPSLFWVEEEDEKKVLMDMYRENTAEKQCKYYTNRSSSSGCPFGNKCFYKHQLPDGSLDPGESPHVRRKPRLADFLFQQFDDDSLDSDDDDGTDLMQTIYAVLAELRGNR